ncbi:MAG: hypothetical protein JXR83_00625 [Deltaproteobacteria bacterium]|nr:hypothetical protein [Deltaproteobacteria bacterium]
MARHSHCRRCSGGPAPLALGVLAGLTVVACQPAPAVDAGPPTDGAASDRFAPDAEGPDRAAADRGHTDRATGDRPTEDAAGPVDAGADASADASADAGADASADAGPAPPFRPDRRGWIELIEHPTRGEAYALIRSGPEVPQPTLLATQGDCAIYTHPMADLCDPPCDGFCAPGGECQPHPQFTSAGAIAVTGLVQALSFVPSTWGYEPTPQPGLDLFAAGALISASAPGEVAPGFSLEVTGVAPLVTQATSLTLIDGIDATVAWTPEHDGRIQLALLVGFHGAPYEALLLCESDDDGELTVPGALIGQLPRPQNANQPHPSSLTRFRRALAPDSSGPIELLVGSRVEVTWSHL